MSQIFGERRAEVERFARHWVLEREPGRVEEMPLGRKSGHTTSSAPSIHVVAHDRMADRREMNADLMSPSGMEMRTKKVPRVEPGKAYEVGLGRPTFIDDCHALPVSWITGYRLVDRQAVAGEMTPRHQRVSSHDTPSGYGRAQQSVRTVRFGDDQQPGRLLVEAVDHTGPLGLTLGRKGAPPAQESVYEGPAPVPRGGMNHHPGGLVHDQQRLVFVDDTDGNVFPGYRPFLDFGDVDANYLARFRAVAGLFAPPIDQYVPLSDQSRRLGTRELGPMGNKQIEADIAVRLDGKRSRVAQTSSPSAYPTWGWGRQPPRAPEIVPLPRGPTPGGRRRRSPPCPRR